ncbi:MAG TPA: hypothetical protein VNE39_00385 [Planctomycetota bacterium]|nr:hypothetical protein [Planctomycetota bacterium]
MSRSNAFVFGLLTLAGAALAAAPLPPSLLPPKEKEDTTKEEEKPNIGDLKSWIRSSNLAEIRDEMFYLDALRGKEPVSVFRRDQTFGETKASFQFKVESVGAGARAVGLIFGSTSGSAYHAVEIGRRDVVLYRVTPGQPRVELDRRGGITRREGEWYEAKVECQGPLVRVFFGDKFLFAFNSPKLQAGYVGFYADESRTWVRRLDVTGQPSRLSQEWKLQ